MTTATSSAGTTRIAVLGAAGKMGRAIVRATLEAPGASLACATETPASPHLKSDAATLAGLPAGGVALTAGTPARGAAEVWIDFTVPAASVENAKSAAALGAALVIGTTGLSEADKAAIGEAARKAAIVLAPNMSVGVNVLLQLVSDATRALGPDFDIDVLEAHHRLKRDAPSGTALRLAEAVAEGRGRPLAELARYERHGEIGARPGHEIGLQTLRGGDVVGDHTVFFFGQGERIEITHRASSRETFAKGAVRAALWLAKKAPGLYDMRDVLGLR